MSAITEAKRAAAHQARLYIDWEKFWSDGWNIKPKEHRLYLGAQRACFDECCARQLCDLSLAPYPELSLIGPYLKACTKGVDEPARLDHPHLLERRPPLYFDGPVVAHDLVYVDLDRAYWSIYTRTTLDVSYDGIHAPSRGLVEFLDPAELGEYKMMRNGLLGMQRRVSRRGVDHGELFYEIVPWHRRRPDLWGLVMDCLELMAWSARDFGAVYYHTDGAIFSSSGEAQAWIEHLSSTFAIRATVRAEGSGYVHALGAFKIGDSVAGKDTPAGSRIDSMLRPPASLDSILTQWLYHSSIPDAVNPTTKGAVHVAQ